MKVVIPVFPGSNCDHDCEHVFAKVLGVESKLLWHREEELGEPDLVVLPGGFSYGDYLRSGAIARFSPVMNSIIDFANGGGMVLGICNGFQILLEAGLLPGALLRNQSLRFVCKDVFLRVENNRTPFTSRLTHGEVLTIPVAHMDGNYFASQELLQQLEENNQIIFRYCDAEGQLTAEANPNGSVGNIAGIINARGNVLGMMPHPERCAEECLGNRDGLTIFESLLDHFNVPA